MSGEVEVEDVIGSRRRPPEQVSLHCCEDAGTSRLLIVEKVDLESLFLEGGAERLGVIDRTFESLPLLLRGHVGRVFGAIVVNPHEERDSAESVIAFATNLRCAAFA